MSRSLVVRLEVLSSTSHQPMRRDDKRHFYSRDPDFYHIKQLHIKNKHKWVYVANGLMIWKLMFKVKLIKCQLVKKTKPKLFVIVVSVGFVIFETVGLQKQVHPHQIELN